MRKILLVLLVLLAVPIAYAGSPWMTLTQTTTCQAVDDSPAVTVLAENSNRLRWSIWTTSGAPTIYFREGGTAAARADHSGFLVGGQSYTEDYAATTQAVSVITLTGTAWVCAKEGVQQ